MDEFPQATDKVSERRQKGGRKQTEKNRQTTDTTEMEEEEGKRGKEGTVRERERESQSQSEPARASQRDIPIHPSICPCHRHALMGRPHVLCCDRQGPFPPPCRR